MPSSPRWVPWLLAPGRLLDTVDASAREHGCRTFGRWLLREESLLDEIAARVRVTLAASGSARA